ncbi:hypothetical protein NN561_004858 [Cricetulus griseus]
MSGPGLAERCLDSTPRACREPPCEEGRGSASPAPRPRVPPGTRVRKHPGIEQPLGTPRSLAQPRVLRPDPWGVLGVTLYSHVPETRSEPEKVTVFWTSTEVASPALCPAQPDLSVVVSQSALPRDRMPTMQP